MSATSAEAHAKLDETLGSHALEGVPILGTIVLVFAIERIANEQETSDLIFGLTGNRVSKNGNESKVKYLYYAVAITSLFASAIPILNKLYFRMKPQTALTAPAVMSAARLSKNLLVLSCTMCLFTLCLQTRNVAMGLATCIACVLAIALLVAYNRHFTKFERDIRPPP